jgi:hypothetical protein
MEQHRSNGPVFGKQRLIEALAVDTTPILQGTNKYQTRECASGLGEQRKRDSGSLDRQPRE